MSIKDYFKPIVEKPKFINPTEYLKTNYQITYLPILKQQLYHKGLKNEIDEFYSILDNPKSKYLISFFKRPIPDQEKYYKRLAQEFYLVIEKDFIKVFIQVLDILFLAGDEIPHIIRGSSGSSLICYLLGITNIDPIKENISLARFMHYQRDDIPDIDIDFPHILRANIYEKIFKLWDGRVARISNHVMFKQKSALKEAMRRHGFRKFLPKDFKMEKYVEKEDEQQSIYEMAALLEGKLKNQSLHCGGIVIFDEKVPDEYYLKDFEIKKGKQGTQIRLNKDEVEDFELIKIDILSNRGLSQLWEISQVPIEDYPDGDFKTKYLFQKGNNLGITYAESRGMRKIFMMLKPQNIQDIATALALIRPAASGQKSEFLRNYDLYLEKKEDFIIYDDDAIQYIQKLLKCHESDADLFRKAFAKNKFYEKRRFYGLLKENNPTFEDEKVDQIMELLEQLQLYSFCKSHAISYAKLVWALGFQKAHHPKEFWCATLNNCNSSFRRWVHFREAKHSGLTLRLGKKPWKIRNDVLVGKDMQMKLISNPVRDYFEYGYWVTNEFLPDMFCHYYMDIPKETKRNPNPERCKICSFRGLVATGRIFSPDKRMKKRMVKQLEGGEEIKNEGKGRVITFFTIGYEDGKYLDLVLWGKYPVGKIHCIEGEGIVKDEDKVPWIEVIKFKFSRI